MSDSNSQTESVQGLTTGRSGYALDMNETITPTLDRLESHLPPVTRRIFKLNRRIATAGVNAAAGATKAVCFATQEVTKRATTGLSTIRGQAESAADRVGSTAKSGVKEVVGQAKAQANATLDTLEDETISLLDDANEAVGDEPSGAYETWTKAELYERAQELDIEGRSSMNKSQLITALRSV